MITIRMNTNRLKMTVEGHALPEESGQWREICAGCSALTQSLMYAAAKYTGEDPDAEEMKYATYKDEPGKMLIKIYAEPEAEDGIRNIFKIYADGLELLAESHPQSVTFIRDERRIQAKEEKGHE